MNAIITRILSEGADDWVFLPLVIREIERQTGFSGERLLSETLNAIRELLENRWMRVGDVKDDFKPWTGTVAESLDRIEREWRSIGIDANLIGVCWFENTAAGDALAGPIPND